MIAKKLVALNQMIKLSSPVYTRDPANPASLRLEKYSLGLFGNPASRGFILIFIFGPNESNKKVLLEQLKMTILIPSAGEIPERR